LPWDNLYGKGTTGVRTRTKLYRAAYYRDSAAGDGEILDGRGKHV